MKSVFLFFALVVIIKADDFVKKTPADIQKAREECWKELQVSEAHQEAMKKYEYPDDPAVHQVVRCTGQKLKVWCEHRGFHKNDLIAQFGEASAPLVEKCITQKSEADSYDRWAWNDWKCLIENGLKDLFKNLEAN